MTLPNVNPVTEMVDLITSSRGYEANVTGDERGQADVLQDPRHPPLMQIPSFQPIQPIDPFGTGSDFQVGSVDSTTSPGASSAAGGFGSMLTQQIAKLERPADHRRLAVAGARHRPGQDVSQVVIRRREGRLAMQLAVQVRNKAVDAYNELFRMQI